MEHPTGNRPRYDSRAKLDELTREHSQLKTHVETVRDGLKRSSLNPLNLISTDPAQKLAMQLEAINRTCESVSESLLLHMSWQREVDQRQVNATDTRRQLAVAEEKLKRLTTAARELKERETQQHRAQSAAADSVLRSEAQLLPAAEFAELESQHRFAAARSQRLVPLTHEVQLLSATLDECKQRQTALDEEIQAAVEERSNAVSAVKSSIAAARTQTPAPVAALTTTTTTTASSPQGGRAGNRSAAEARKVAAALAKQCADLDNEITKLRDEQRNYYSGAVTLEQYRNAPDYDWEKDPEGYNSLKRDLLASANKLEKDIQQCQEKRQALAAQQNDRLSECLYSGETSWLAEQRRAEVAAERTLSRDDTRLALQQQLSQAWENSVVVLGRHRQKLEQLYDAQAENTRLLKQSEAELQAAQERLAHAVRNSEDSLFLEQKLKQERNCLAAAVEARDKARIARQKFDATTTELRRIDEECLKAELEIVSLKQELQVHEHKLAELDAAMLTLENDLKEKLEPELRKAAAAIRERLSTHKEAWATEGAGAQKAT